jgi:hypothetical protein
MNKNLDANKIIILGPFLSIKIQMLLNMYEYIETDNVFTYVQFSRTELKNGSETVESFLYVIKPSTMLAFKIFFKWNVKDGKKVCSHSV